MVDWREAVAFVRRHAEEWRSWTEVPVEARKADAVLAVLETIELALVDDERDGTAFKDLAALAYIWEGCPGYDSSWHPAAHPSPPTTARETTMNQPVHDSEGRFCCATCGRPGCKGC